MNHQERVAFFYKKERAKNHSAKSALRTAKYEALYGEGTKKDRIMPYAGDKVLTNLPNGWQIKVEIEYDSDTQTPWEACDGMGVVKRCHGRPDEAYENWILNQDRGWYRYYDWKATLPEALKDGWGAAPYGEGTKKERVLRAMRSTYEYLRRWCNDQWHFVGLIVTLLDENGDELDEDSCWGMDSSNEAYLCSEARSWAAAMIRNQRELVRKQKHDARIASRFADAMACGV